MTYARRPLVRAIIDSYYARTKRKPNAESEILRSWNEHMPSVSGTWDREIILRIEISKSMESHYWFYEHVRTQSSELLQKYWPFHLMLFKKNINLVIKYWRSIPKERSFYLNLLITTIRTFT